MSTRTIGNTSIVTKTNTNHILTVITFLYPQPRRWAEAKYEPYTARHVNALWRACADRIKIPHRFICFTNELEGIECETQELWEHVWINGENGCYLRLKAFDGEFQASLGGTHTMCIDLDTVIYKDCTDLIQWAMEKDFVIVKGSYYGRSKGRAPMAHYNGSLWVCKNGTREIFWRSLYAEDVEDRRAKFRMPGGLHALGTDQAWISIVSPNEETFKPEQGVVQFRQHSARGFPPNTCIVFFAGKVKPWDSWVKEHFPKLYEEWARYADSL